MSTEPNPKRENMEINFTSTLETFLSREHSDKTLDKGKECIGEFTNRLVSQNRVIGVTKGRYGVYNTRLSIDEDGVSVDCDCPSSKLTCHHAIGLAFTYINFPNSFLTISSVASKLKQLRKEELIEIIYRIAPIKPPAINLVEQALSKKKK